MNMLFKCNAGRVTGAIGLVLTASLLWPASSWAAPKKTKRSTVAAAAIKGQEMMPAEEFRKQEDWRLGMRTVPHPKSGCFTAKYPAREWQEQACVSPPNIPMPPKRGITPLVIGGNNDISAGAPGGASIVSAFGSFNSVSGVTSLAGPVGNTGPSITNAYSLQLNTDFFSSAACAGSPNANCRGWEQFVYFSTGTSAMVFMQYWLIQYNASCPAGGWTAFSFSGDPDIYCYKNNSAGAMPVPVQAGTNLAQLTLAGITSGATDSVIMTAGASAYTTTGDNAVNAGGGWTIAEFNVFGAGGNSAGGGQASFNSGANVVVRTRIDYGGTAPPNCMAQGFTAETNNLNFGPTPPLAAPPGPAISFRETTAGGSPTNCAAATAVGDTHLTTLNGLLYDFQATGDFELLQTKSGFIVQNRQVSGAPSWPNASVNTAVATLMDKSRVAVCLKPQRVVVDGRELRIPQGGARILADGTQVSLRGNSYLIRGTKGDWVKADVNPGYIDVNVGLGQWPIEAQGLLVNVKGDPNQIATREGRILTNPFAFEELYHPYADSWRVKGAESMLNVCGERVAAGAPDKPFFVKDLPPALAKRARAICQKNGVKQGPLFDACVLDVTVIGSAKAATVHARTLPPAVVGQLR